MAEKINPDSYNPRFCPFYKDGYCLELPRAGGVSIEWFRKNNAIKPCLMKGEANGSHPLTWDECGNYLAGCEIAGIKEQIEEEKKANR